MTTTQTRVSTTHAVALMALACAAAGAFYGKIAADDSGYEMLSNRVSDGELTMRGVLIAIVYSIVAGMIGAALGLFAESPYLVATGNRHHNATAIRLCGWFGLLLPPAWIVGMVWAVTKPRVADVVAGEQT